MSKMIAGTVLIGDPCYIKNVTYNGESRFDALRCIKVLHDGDDGDFPVWVKGELVDHVGVDSWRVWMILVEFECDVEIDAGFSSFMEIPPSERGRTLTEGDVTMSYIEAKKYQAEHSKKKEEMDA